MAKEINKLSAKAVNALNEPGLYPDGNGLYLQVSKTKTKSWLLRFMLYGKRREMGLGSLKLTSLKEARLKAEEAQSLLKEGIDPIEARKTLQRQRRLETEKQKTFKECAIPFMEKKLKEFRNAKHRQDWPNSLEMYVYPAIGDLPVSEVDTGLVLKILEPIWEDVTETATRVRGRIENILDWATVHGYREGNNPAKWKGHLSQLLPAPNKIKEEKHLPALPYAEVATFMKELRLREGSAARCLELQILAAIRPGEAVFTEWDEFDFENKSWLIPAHRMKGGKRDHRVPLTKQMITLLEKQPRFDGVKYVFTNPAGTDHLSNNAVLQLRRRMGYAHITPHGFRSSFSDWASETTNYPSEVREMALAHEIPNKVEAAYRRGDLFEKRRRLMQNWADYCDREKIETENVLTLTNVNML